MRPTTRARFIDWLLKPYHRLYNPEASKKYWLLKGREIERKHQQKHAPEYPFCPTCSDARKDIFIPLFREIIGSREVYACPFTERHMVDTRLYPDTLTPNIYPDIEAHTDPRTHAVLHLPTGEWMRRWKAEPLIHTIAMSDTQLLHTISVEPNRKESSS